jgi:hypothetical protein
MAVPDPFSLGFVCAGPQRTGSTWLHERLRPHPALAFPKDVKETFYFDRHFAKGPAWYAWHFRDAAPGALAGEIAPTYFDDAAAVARLRAHSPDARVVLTLREPLGRALSLFHHHLRKGRVPGAFAEAVGRIPQIETAGLYAEHVPRWLDAFGPERVLVLPLDDLAADPAGALVRVCAFLGVPPVEVTREVSYRVNEASAPRFPWLAAAAARAVTALRGRRFHALVEAGKKLGLKRVYSGGTQPLPALPDAERARLSALYAPHVGYVEGLLGRPLPAWRAAVGLPLEEVAWPA